MVAPIVDFPLRVVQTKARYSYQVGKKQAPPYTVATGYVGNFCNGPGTTTQPDAHLVIDHFNPYLDTNIINMAKIKAYDALKDSLSSNASVGVSLAEFGQSLSMITLRTTQILRFLRRINQFDIVGAYDALGLNGKSVLKQKYRNSSRRHLRHTKSVSDLYLEGHFGWAPLCNDIYDSYQVLANPVKDKSIQGSCTSSYSYPRGTPVPYARTYSESGTVSIRYGAKVEVTNPNLAYAQQLGLANPALVLVETVRLSFVLDWFTNLNQFLGMGTDFLGLSVKEPYTTLTRRASLFCTLWGGYIPGGGGSIYIDNVARYSIVKTTRTLGLGRPDFGFRSEQVWGWRRAAAAASLITQALTKLR